MVFIQVSGMEPHCYCTIVIPFRDSNIELHIFNKECEIKIFDHSREMYEEHFFPKTREVKTNSLVYTIGDK